MKKLSITIALIIASFFTANAIVLENKRIIFQDNCIWDEDVKSLPFIPIDAFIKDNSYIIVDFFNDLDQSATFQIQDHSGNIIYHETNSSISYKISLDNFKPGQ